MVQQGGRVNQRSREVLEGEKQKVSGNLTKDSSTRTDHKKFHTSHQGNKLMSSTWKNLVCHTYSLLRRKCRGTTDGIHNAVKQDTGSGIAEP